MRVYLGAGMRHGQRGTGVGRSVPRFAALLFAALLSTSGCSRKEEGAAPPDPQLALIDAPKAGDLYAAEVTAFSRADFGADEEKAATAYALMKVVSVRDGGVVVVTEDSATVDPRVPKQQILGNVAGARFDMAEPIEIDHDALRMAYLTGKIYAVRR